MDSLNITPKSSSAGKTLALLGAFFQLGPIISIVGMLLSISGLFNFMPGFEIHNPEHTASNVIGTFFIGSILVVLGLIFGGVGFILLFVSLLACRYRAPWFFWFLVIYGGILCMRVSFISVPGIFFLVYCLIYKDKFLSPKPTQE